MNAIAAPWLNLEIVMLSQVSQTEEEKYCMTSLICGILKEMVQMNLLTKQRLTDLENKHDCQGVGIVKEFGKVMYTLLYSNG